MGKPMAKNILKAGGHTLRFYARRPEIRTEMEALGAEYVGQLSQLGQGCDVVFTMLPDGPDVKKVVLGEGGVAQGMEKGSVLIDCSSINPAHSREIAEGLAEKGIEMLDAPVTGGESGAIRVPWPSWWAASGKCLTAASLWWPPWPRALPTAARWAAATPSNW